MVLIGGFGTHVVSGFWIFEGVNGVLTEYGRLRPRPQLPVFLERLSTNLRLPACHHRPEPIRSNPYPFVKLLVTMNSKPSELAGDGACSKKASR